MDAYEPMFRSRDNWARFVAGRLQVSVVEARRLCWLRWMVRNGRWYERE